jgi:nickel/cobalt transporter (NicO) family protein
MKPWCLLPFCAAVALASLLPSRASAHLVNTDVGEFYAGMMHPLTSAEHLLPILVLALLASQCGKPAARATLLAFPMALLVGTLAGSRLPPFAFLHLANLVVLLGLGGLLALGDRLKHIPPAAVGGLALLTGVILGYRSGMNMAASKVAAQFIPGVAFTGLIVVALIAAWVPMLSSRFNLMRMTLAGGAFGVVGIVLLLQLLTDAALPSARGTRLPGQEDLLAMLRAGEFSVPPVIGALLAVTIWGAGHALTPGHGKTIVAAYLIGSRSTPWHALYLGVTWRSLLGLGVSGGLLPCPSALVLLLTAVSLNRAALGMVLVVAFSLGLAGVLTTVGLLFVKGSRLVQQLPWVGMWSRLLPAASALVIMMIGIWLTAEAVSRI